jgi:hypothetical protein
MLTYSVCLLLVCCTSLHCNASTSYTLRCAMTRLTSYCCATHYTVMLFNDVHRSYVSSEAEGGAYESEVTQPSFSSASEDTVEDDQQLHQGNQTYTAIYTTIYIHYCNGNCCYCCCCGHHKRRRECIAVYPQYDLEAFVLLLPHRVQVSTQLSDSTARPLKSACTPPSTISYTHYIHIFMYIRYIL